MLLKDRLQAQVPVDVQHRGQLWQKQSGGVEIVGQEDTMLWAEVSDGLEIHRTVFDREGGTLHVACNCGLFQEEEAVCSHIWATVLTADDYRLLTWPGDSGSLVIHPDPDLTPCLEDEEEGEGDEDEWDEGEWDEDEPGPWRGDAGNGRDRGRGKTRREPTWEEMLEEFRAGAEASAAGRARGSWPADRQLLYVLDLAATQRAGRPILDVQYRDRKADGSWGKPRARAFTTTEIEALPDAADRRILAMLRGIPREGFGGYSGYYGGYYGNGYSQIALTGPLQEEVLREACRSGRLFLRPPGVSDLSGPLVWDDGPPWELWLDVARQGDHYALATSLRRGEETAEAGEVLILLADGLVVTRGGLARFDHRGGFAWTAYLQHRKLSAIPAGESERLLEKLLSMPVLPRVSLPPELNVERVAPEPRPRLTVSVPRQSRISSRKLEARLSFDYDGVVVEHQPFRPGAYQKEPRRWIVRDAEAERRHLGRLLELGCKEVIAWGRPATLELASRGLPRLVSALLADGWHVEAEGKVYRQSSGFHIEVQSGIDWFELHGGASFGDQTASLPDLLAALKRGENTVPLGDGTHGILPEEWLKKYGLLAGMGTAKEDHVRFGRSQVGLLDALLASQPEVSVDEVFAQARDRLKGFEGVRPQDPPEGFVGVLRGYQREGLGWLSFLESFGFGGCLADDMGLGKTIQVLALLERRRQLRAAPGPGEAAPPPSLVVVPRSLIFNWKEEAARFTPGLRVLDHTGTGRDRKGATFADHDVVLTTYGTLRRDALLFKDLHFDYCILDEAQSIKNASSESAKAARLVRADHRLALSGTPIENHLGELWSLFEFLNPGMLGSGRIFSALSGARAGDPELRRVLAGALRPFLLRRTKKQVVKDLPERTEQTIYCELEAAQRKQYNELRDHYRHSLLGKVEKEGLARAKIQVLEALLRLRQAACHPGLIDARKKKAASAKIDTLMAQLSEVLDEGHKVLVFSQFTSLLAILRERLDQEKLRYTYLDGKTRNRQEKVEQFQKDQSCRLFLISLKAGGLGLNLTAAEYVFLLDPWWNPAVEAQAIDRAHRIGQTRPVFAYRLIARDTVEEKVLQLQQTKRELADAIISQDNALLRDLTAEDLKMLLS